MRNTIKFNKYEFRNLINECVKRVIVENNELMDLPVIIVGGPLEGKYTLADIYNNFSDYITGEKEPSQNPRINNPRLIGKPILRDYIGPMDDGGRLRYESEEAYNFFSV